MAGPPSFGTMLGGSQPSFGSMLGGSQSYGPWSQGYGPMGYEQGYEQGYGQTFGNDLISRTRTSLPYSPYAANYEPDPSYLPGSQYGSVASQTARSPNARLRTGS